MKKDCGKFLFEGLRRQRLLFLFYVLLLFPINLGIVSCSSKGVILEKDSSGKTGEKLRTKISKEPGISLDTPGKLLSQDSKTQAGKRAEGTTDIDEETVIHISGAISEIQKQSGATYIEGKTELKPQSESKDSTVTQIENAEKKEAPKSFQLKEGKISGISQEDPPIPPALQGQKFVFNFSKMDIISVIKIIAEELKFNYIVENGVGGVVTLQTESPVPYEYLFPVLKQILATYNLSIVKEDKYYKIAPMTDIQRKPIGTYIGKDGKSLPLDHSMVIQLIPLNYLPPDQLKEVLSPLLTSSGSFINFPVPKLLGIIDTAVNIRRLLDIISAMDVNMFGSMNVQLFKIMFGKADELNKELIDVFSTLGLPQKDNFLKFVAIPRINSILAVSANKEYLETLETWIKKLDIPEAGAGVLGTYIYRVQNGDAGNIAGIVQALFKVKNKGETKIPEQAEKIAFQPPIAKMPPGQQQKVVSPPVNKRSIEISGVTEIEGELQVVSDAATNSIIIRTNPIYYPVILETIRELDKIPMQVMIEILVAELTLDKNTQFGVEWATQRGQFGASLDSGSGLGSQLEDEVFTSVSGGVSYFIHDSKKIFGLIKAKAVESKLNILSSPVILTSDNKQASIKITSDVPIVTTQTANANTSSQQLVQNVEYKSAGIILSVTPRINSEKFVSMDVTQTVSQVGEKAAGSAPNDPPPFFTREAQTSVVVKDRETLIIGGLITNTERNSRGGVPWLSKIPFLGWLFGSWSDSTSKTELILLITPRVIESVSDAKKLTDSFKERIEFLQYKVTKDKT